MDDRQRSRRSILKFAGLLTGASLASGLTRDALAQQKASKQAMKYQDKPKNGAIQMNNGTCYSIVL